VKWPFLLGHWLSKLWPMNASTAFTPSSALAAPDRDAVRAALVQLSDALGGVPVTAIECGVGDFTSVARGKSVGHQDFVGMAGCRFPSVVFGLTVSGYGEPIGRFHGIAAHFVAVLLACTFVTPSGIERD